MDIDKMKFAEKNKHNERLIEIADRLDLIDAVGAESRAIEILIGLGFRQHELHKKSKEFSGGWRMRIALSKVIFSEPDVLLLDEPTNHLDLVALIWLEEYVQCLDATVVIVSHARDFLN